MKYGDIRLSCNIYFFFTTGPLGGIAITYYGVRPVAASGIFVAVVMLLVAGFFPSFWILGLCYFFIGENPRVFLKSLMETYLQLLIGIRRYHHSFCISKTWSSTYVIKYFIS